MESVTVDSKHGSNILKTPSWFLVATPVVCIIGFGGNLLNLIVLQRQRTSNGNNSFIILLISVALSDMFFCITVLLSSIMQDEFIVLEDLVPRSKLYKLFVLYYGTAAINMFLMTSTWLVVTTAFTRLIGISFNSQTNVLYKHKFTAIFVIIFCALLSVPLCLYLEINHISLALPSLLSANNSTLSGDNLTLSTHIIFYGNETARFMTLYGYYARYSNPIMNLFAVYINCVWPVLASFAPCFVLIVCNVLLIHRLRAAIWARRSLCLYLPKKRHNKESRLTFTLIIMFGAHVVLVLPSEVLKYYSPNRVWGETGHQVAAVTNFMQTCNFAGNFILYLITNFSFRKAIERCLKSTEKRREDERNKSGYLRCASQPRELFRDASLTMFSCDNRNRHCSKLISSALNSPDTVEMSNFLK